MTKQKTVPNERIYPGFIGVSQHIAHVSALQCEYLVPPLSWRTRLYWSLVNRASQYVDVTAAVDEITITITLEDIETHLPMFIDIGIEYLGQEASFRWHHRVGSHLGEKARAYLSFCQHANGVMKY